jgi:hypothetical protein
MTTTLDTLCSENTMVLSARRGFLHACISEFPKAQRRRRRQRETGSFMKLRMRKSEETTN